MSEQQPQQPEQPGGRPPVERGEMPPAKFPQIYVANLAAYNNGVLHGMWIDAARPAQQLQKIIQAMLKHGPEPGAEEWAIHDYQAFGEVHLDEYEDLNIISALAQGIVQHGPAYAAWASIAGRDLESLARFEEAFLGTWDKVEDYAEELLDGIGATTELAALPEWLHPYVKLDIESFARDLVLGGDISVADDEGKVHVFDGHA